MAAAPAGVVSLLAAMRAWGPLRGRPGRRHDAHSARDGHALARKATQALVRIGIGHGTPCVTSQHIFAGISRIGNANRALVIQVMEKAL
jgi:hypothetical protein